MRLTPAATAAFLSTLLLTGILGWSAGWLAAGTEIERQGRVDPTTTAQPTGRPTTASPTPPPTRSNAGPTQSATRADAFPMPDLVNMNFREAKRSAEQKRLGVNVNFREPGSKPAGTVVRTLPDEKVLVWPGVTIQLYVTGDPPRVVVPDVIGRSCQEGKEAILNSGLKIQEYPSGEKGTVTRIDPLPGTQKSWNDQVKLFCAE